MLEPLLHLAFTHLQANRPLEISYHALMQVAQLLALCYTILVINVRHSYRSGAK